MKNGVGGIKIRADAGGRIKLKYENKRKTMKNKRKIAGAIKKTRGSAGEVN